jgi:ABC-2 type transport system permease protein/oleandomycin transport system permease protein
MSDLALSTSTEPSPFDSMSSMFRDIGTVTKRNLIRVVRVPEALFFTLLQPIMFVLLFRYVFGGAIPVEGTSYVNYLMPGIFVQTMCFGAVSTAIGLAEDLQSGLLERFRALPMSRAAVLGGRTTADVARNVVVIALMSVVGFLVGFRPSGTIATYVAACLLMLLFSYALMWGFAYVGLWAPNAETAQLMTFPILFPLTFASTAFVPVSTMPGWLQGFAENQPVSVTVNAVRSLMIGGTYYSEDAVLKAIAWSLGLLIILVPIAVRQYRRV